MESSNPYDLQEAYLEIYRLSEGPEDALRDRRAVEGGFPGGNDPEPRRPRPAGTQKPETEEERKERMRRHAEVSQRALADVIARIKKEHGDHAVISSSRTRGGSQAESYELVLDYLIDEGYADTFEAAKVILDNMSDEWLEDILDEATIKNPTQWYPGRHGKTQDQERKSRSLGGKMSQGDENQSGATFTHGRRKPVGSAVPLGVRQPDQGRMDQWGRDEMKLRRANLKAGNVSRVGGPRGIPG